jgi:hypothetical protein
MANREYGIRWTESTGRALQVVTKERFFVTAKARETFLAMIERKAKFIEARPIGGPWLAVPIPPDGGPR